MNAVWKRALTVLLEEIDLSKSELRGRDFLATHELFGMLIQEFRDVEPDDVVAHLRALGVEQSVAEDIWRVYLAVEHLLVGPKHIHWSPDVLAQITREAN